MSARSGGGGGGDDDMVVILVMLAGVMLLGYIGWTLFGDTILLFLMEGARWLLTPPRWFVNWLPVSYIDSYNNVARYLVNTPASDYTLDAAKVVYRFISMTYYFVLLPFVLWLAYALYRRPIAAEFEGGLTLKQLIARNKRYYPQIRPAFFHDLLNEDPDHGPFARALDYRRFAERHNILLDANDTPTHWREWHSDITDPSTYDQEATGNPDEPRIPVPYPAPRMSGPRVRALLRAQLGGAWTGNKSLPPFHRALFGVFAARIARDKTGADAALFQLNATWMEAKKAGKAHRMNCKKALALADKYGDHIWVNQVIKRHHFTNVVFSALLASARDRSGKLPTSMFLWLKVVDRPLYYSLNQVGRRVAWIEAAGVRAHEKAELKDQAAITQPMVEAGLRQIGISLIKESYLDPDYRLIETSSA